MCVAHAAAAALPVYPVAHVQPVTEKPIIFLLFSRLFIPLYPVTDVGVLQMDLLQPLKEYFVLCVVHATAAALPVYPVAHVQPVT